MTTDSLRSLRRRLGIRGALVAPLFVYLPAAVALAIILLAGWFAEQQSRDLVRQNTRAEVLGHLGNLRADLERVIGDQMALLTSLSGALAAAPDMDEAQFRDVVDTLGDSARPMLAVGADPVNGPPMIVAESADGAARLREILGEIPADAPGVRAIARGKVPALALWNPVRGRGSGGGTANWGSVAGVTSTAQLFQDAAIWGNGLDVALLSKSDKETGGARALHYGSGGVLGADPVTVTVALAGEPWVLAAAPRDGWPETTSGYWTIRALTLMSAALIVGPIAYTRRLAHDRQRSLEKLREREGQLDRISRRLGLALEASHVGVWDYNIDTGGLVWDNRMDELYGMPPDGRPRRREDWSDRLHPDDAERAEREFHDGIERTGRYDSSFRVVLPDGSQRNIKTMGAVFENADGTRSILGVNWDVTLDVRRNEELVARRKEAEAASVAKSQFLATMSHEIRTPMNGVIGMLDLMLRGDLAGDQRDRARIAKESASHLLHILNDVLDFSKLEANRIELQSTRVDARAIVEGAVSLMAAVAHERHLEVTAEIAPDVPEAVVADGTRIRQVLMNLTGNAVKFTEAGRVTVRVAYDRDAGGVLMISVTDTGVGIPEAARSRLFQRFNQVDSSITRVRGGTGLGLAISRQLVELMGGEISVESAPGQGSSFRFWIPAPAASGPAETASAKSGGGTAPVISGPPQRILVAEDNATNRLVLSSYLKLAGHHATFVCNGAEAIARLQQQEFDMLILDIRMPVMDGATAAAMIRQLGGRHGDIPIIALTADAMGADRAAYLEAGMTDYLTKPVAAEALYAAIDRAAAGYSSTGAQPSPGSNAVIAAAASRVSSPRSAS